MFGPTIPCGCFKEKSVNMKSGLSHATNDIKGQIKEQVFGKSVEESG